MSLVRFRDSDDFAPTIDAAAEQLGTSPTAVEKDYWVSEVLHVLADRFPGDFIFKGGTSLSKGYRILERFSEDVDVLVLQGARGRGTTDRLMKDMAKAAAADIGGTCEAVGDSETGRHRSYDIGYPATRSATPLLRAAVLLEMGVRGGPEPHEMVSIGCLLGDALAAAGTDLAAYADLVPFDVAVLHPGRTLLEKLALIHALAQQLAANPNASIPARAGRHFYDVQQLLNDVRVLALLADRVKVSTVLADVAQITGQAFQGAAEVPPSGGFGTCPAFDPSSVISRRLQAGAMRPP